MASTTRRAKPPAGPSDTEARILAATERLLGRGERFTELPVQRVLTEAGVSRATFYAHFKDKTDLVLRLTDDVRRRSLDLAQNWRPESADGYARFFTDVIALHRSKAPVLAALREVAVYDATVRGFYTADLEGFDEVVLQALLDQQAAGLTSSDVDAAAASRVIVWGGAQAIARHIEVDDGSGDGAFARELARIWWYGAFRRTSN
ncbi:TetR/AcrR family transcriptional regulator [Paractinoplanes atraurantiacus]|uniref:DNA-binding transcriptional regulator, AcrR family n=1 Tax=Paractinoplanes atraurantiacus TaxID=1036182 RepID=A0A285K7B1_9ACTN|nr:TetR/AcrR family transcriptional regulator [Actinoplanes atraurantiacus]SNY67386.1 DNA-binding transcriptional regulator, AcrR family [Actinoplanes atraurantiacus]